MEESSVPVDYVRAVRSNPSDVSLRMGQVFS